MNNEFTRMQKLAGIITEGYTDAKRVDNAHDLGKSGEENLYGAGVKKGEEIEKRKLTKEEAKEMIKDAILAEMHGGPHPNEPDEMESGAWDLAMREEDTIEEASTEALDRMDGLVDQRALGMALKGVEGIIASLRAEDFDEEDIHDYLIYLVTTLDDSALMEAKKDKEEVEDVEIEDTETVEEPAEGEDMVDVDMEGGEDMDAGSDEAKTAFDELTDAYRSAKELGDEKLIRQLANTITYFNKNIILK